MAGSPFLFLSYTRADRDRDAYKVIERFYEDLCQELQPALERDDRIGFLDTREIELGADWSDELREALATCRVFVPILSRKYFSSEWCGQEWTYFSKRVEAATKAGAKPPRLIAPVLLVGSQRIPKHAVADGMMNRIDAFPDAYNEGGLRKVKLNAPWQVYRSFVTAFAEELLASVDAHELSPADDPGDVSAMPNAFRPGASATTQPAGEISAALHFAQFVYVAGRRTELGATRRDVRCYGERSGAEWRPYAPDEPRAVAVMATAVTTQEDFIYEPVPLDETLIERLDEAEQQHKVVVLIVDVWTLRLPRYKELMDELDRYSYPNTVVVVLTNPQDPETKRLAAKLRDEVLWTFKKRVASGNPDQLVVGLSTSSDFKNALARKLHAARDRVRRQLDPTRTATGEGPGSLPTIGSG